MQLTSKLYANQSPLPIFRCDEERTYFQIELPVKPGFDGFADLSLLEDQPEDKGSVKSSVKSRVKSSVNVREKTSEKMAVKVAVKLAEIMAVKIIESLRKNPELTIKELSSKLGISIRSVERSVRNLKDLGKLRRVGPGNGGYWQVID